MHEGRSVTGDAARDKTLIRNFRHRAFPHGERTAAVVHRRPQGCRDADDRDARRTRGDRAHAVGMGTTVQPTFGIERWDEQPTWQGDDRKVTRATVVKRYHGALEATGTMEYVMAYAPDGTARYVGLERVDG